MYRDCILLNSLSFFASSVFSYRLPVAVQSMHKLILDYTLL